MSFYILPLLITEDILPIVEAGQSSVFQNPDIVAASVTELLINSLIIGKDSIIVPITMWGLVLMSCIAWGIVFTKTYEMILARKQSKKFLDFFWTTKNFTRISAICDSLPASPVASVYADGHKELMKIVEARETRTAIREEFSDIENIERALKRSKTAQLSRLEKGITFLATTASASPFVGLFGTVWGIMQAFIGLSQASSSSIQAVAPGISMALVTTVVGLAAAIPAGIAFNYFNHQVHYLSREIDKFSAEFLNISKRNFL